MRQSVVTINMVVYIIRFNETSSGVDLTVVPCNKNGQYILVYINLSHPE